MSVTFHRNGVGGAGFYVVYFTDRIGRELAHFMGIVFPTDKDLDPADDTKASGWRQATMKLGRIAVLRLDGKNGTDSRVFSMGRNSWRGSDEYGDLLARYIIQYEKRRKKKTGV